MNNEQLLTQSEKNQTPYYKIKTVLSLPDYDSLNIALMGLNEYLGNKNRNDV